MRRSIPSFETRVKWEEEIECFLFHIIGAKDAFLCRINEKLSLGIDRDECADVEEINKRINPDQKKSIISFQ